MEYLLFGKAAIIGLSIAAPVGPIGLLCMQRTLSHGARKGFVCGLGAATADAMYGAIGAFGLTTLTQLFTSISMPMALFGAALLIGMGIRLIQTPGTTETATCDNRTSPLKNFVSTMLLTLTNPMTILSFMAVFSALSGTVATSSTSAVTMVTGVFIGSASWWLLLALCVSLIRHKIGPQIMHRINQTAGAVLVMLGGWQLSSFLH